MLAHRRSMHLALSATLSALFCVQALAQAAASSEIEKGRYLARVGDCVSCHTAAGGKPYAGGLPIKTGFGTLFSPNITPDKETGIGNWSAEAFYAAMHTGHDDEGKHLYPAFPYPWFTKVTQADVQSIKAFLGTVEPVKQANKPTQLSWWLSWRALVAGWNLLNFDKGEFTPRPDRAAQWNRGAYLVEGLGHCGQCHTAKGPLGGTRTGEVLEGGSLPEGWYAPSLASDLRAGLGGWTAAEIVEYLKTGSTASAAPAGPMSEVIANSTRYFSDADLNAVATYLKDMPADTHDEPKTRQLANQALARGQAVFTDNCAGCHMPDGRGIPGVFPALAGSSAIQAGQAATVLRVVLQGDRIVRTPAKPTGIAMPAFDWKLNDDQVADVVNYIRNAWGNRASSVSTRAVAKVRKSLDVSNTAR